MLISKCFYIQIEFDTHVARSLQVVPKEMPTVEERIANVTENPEVVYYYIFNITYTINNSKQNKNLLCPFVFIIIKTINILEITICRSSSRNIERHGSGTSERQYMCL